MKLTERFQRLTLWNKIGAIGSIASIMGLILTLAIPSDDSNKTTIEQACEGDDCIQIKVNNGIINIGAPAKTAEGKKQ